MNIPVSLLLAATSGVEAFICRTKSIGIQDRRVASRQTPYFLSKPTKSRQKMAATAWGIKLSGKLKQQPLYRAKITVVSWQLPLF
jgi:hypothetical protein